MDTQGNVMAIGLDEVVDHHWKDSQPKGRKAKAKKAATSEWDKSQVHCRFYRNGQGECRAGDACEFLHEWRDPELAAKKNRRGNKDAKGKGGKAKGAGKDKVAKGGKDKVAKGGKDIRDGAKGKGSEKGKCSEKGGDKDIKKICKSLASVEEPEARVKKLVATDGIVGEFAWISVRDSLAYAARRVGEIADSVEAIDDAMRWGFNWELGPFQIWDALGFAETIERMKKDGVDLPDSVTKMHAAGAKGFYVEGKVYDLGKGDYIAQRTDPREAPLSAVRKGEPVLKNNSAVAYDLGDGILGVTFTSKANSLDEHNIGLLHEAVAKAEEDFRGMVLFNQGDNFCVGANLFLVAAAAAQKQFDQISDLVKRYQDATQAMKYARVPVVAAPYGMTLGGGLELCFGCDAVQAALETYSGLVEPGVGLIPGGAGTLNMLWRQLESIPEGVEVNAYPYVTQVFKNIAMAKVATSALEAKELGFFRHTDGVSFDAADEQLLATLLKLVALTVDSQR